MKSSGVRFLSCGASRGSDRFTVTVSIRQRHVLLEWNPQIVRFFLEHGADPVEGAPFAVAFSEKITTALGVFVQLKRSRSELSAALQEQADSALRYFCDKGDMKWVPGRWYWAKKAAGAATKKRPLLPRIPNLKE